LSHAVQAQRRHKVAHAAIIALLFDLARYQPTVSRPLGRPGQRCERLARSGRGCLPGQAPRRPDGRGNQPGASPGGGAGTRRLAACRGVRCLPRNRFCRDRGRCATSYSRVPSVTARSRSASERRRLPGPRRLITSACPRRGARAPRRAGARWCTRRCPRPARRYRRGW